MKKLIIAAFAIACAAAVQAATIEWSQVEGEVYGTDGKILADDTVVYLISASYADTAFVTAWADGGIEGALEAAGSNVIATDGYIYEGYVDTLDSTYTTREVSAYYAIVKGDELFISETIDSYNDPIDTGLSYLDFGEPTASKLDAISADSYAGGSAWVNVPEPTTGLLMLIGMAGLALRRRRA